MEPVSENETRIIEMSRRLARSLLAKLHEQGVEPADAAIGFAYAMHDAATGLTGDRMQAVEWMRTAADVMERQLMGGDDGKPASH